VNLSSSPLRSAGVLLHTCARPEWPRRGKGRGVVRILGTGHLGFNVEKPHAYTCPTGHAGPARPDVTSGRYESSCLAGHASTGFVSGLRPKARPAGRFSCCVGPWPIKSTTTHFYQYFFQTIKYFIIFTNNLSFLLV